MSDAKTNRYAPISFKARSDIGMRRNNNQDAWITLPAEDESVWLNRGHVFVVADGMGAHAAGELASKLAADGVVHHYRKLRQLSPPEAILKAFRDTNGEIHGRGQANSEFHNMGTTCSALLLLPQGVLAAHVGDSRIYRVRGTRLEQLTFDHSLVWEMRAASSGLGQDTSTLNIPKNVITRSLGPQPNVQVDLEGPFELLPGDKFLLCSDGLTGRVEDTELGVIVSLLPPDEASQVLIDLANLRGGPDNITVIVVDATEGLADSRTWRGEPLVVGQELRPAMPIPNAVWISIALGLVIAAGLTILQYFLSAIIAGSLAALAALLAWSRSRPAGEGVPLIHGRRLGRGPYVCCDLEPVQDQLFQMTESLRRHLDQTLSGADLEVRARALTCLAEVDAKIQEPAPVEALRMWAAAVRILQPK